MVEAAKGDRISFGGFRSSDCVYAPSCMAIWLHAACCRDETVGRAFYPEPAKVRADMPGAYRRIDDVLSK